MQAARAWASRVRESPVGRRAAAVVASRTFRCTSGVLTVGCLSWEAISHFASMHEEHGMAELCFGLDTAVRRARHEKELKFRAMIEESRRQAAAGKVVDPLSAHRLLYPTLSPEELRARRDQYGAVKWTDEALMAVVAHSPLVEVGAGRGQWQRALTERGADVLAFDDMSSPATQRGFVGKVSQGDEEVVKRHSDRSLLLVYPNPGPMAQRCLDNYTGNTLVFVGEGRGGVNGDDAFFDTLQREWRLVDSKPVDKMPDCYEHLYVLQRR